MLLWTSLLQTRMLPRPSPSEDFKTYYHLILRMAKVTNLEVTQTQPDEDEDVFKYIDEDKPSPLNLAFIPSLMKLVKQLWQNPTTVSQIPHRT